MRKGHAGMPPLLKTILFMRDHLEPGNLRSAVKFILVVLYMPSEMAGYPTLVITIPAYSTDRAQSMTKELYPSVGRQLGVSGLKVGKDIREVIKKGWQRRDKEVWEPYFPQEKTPTNREFIARMTDVLELWQEVVKAKKRKVP